MLESLVYDPTTLTPTPIREILLGEFPLLAPSQVPRELRNLAMPDRDWNVAVPFFTTASKTREQFSSSADTQAAAAVAREMHQARVEAAAEAEGEED